MELSPGAGKPALNKLSTMGLRVKRNAEKIVQAWASRARQNIYAARKQNRKDLIDNFPDMLTAIAAALAEGQARPGGPVSEVAQKHGAERAALGTYTLHEVLAEYQVFRQVLFETLEKEGPLSRRERNMLMDSVELAMAESAAKFVAGHRWGVTTVENTILKLDRSRLSFLWRYGFGFLGSIVGLYLHGLVYSVIGGIPFLVPLAAVVGASLLGGIGPGLVSLGISTAALVYFFTPPFRSFAVSDQNDLLRLALFFVLAAFVVYVSSLLRSVLRKIQNNESAIREAHMKLDEEVQQRSLSLVALEQERDMRERFVSALTHDLRNPLWASRLSAQMLMRLPCNPQHKEITDRIIRGLDRAERMISDLLDANRIRAGEQLPLKITECHLKQICQETIEELATMARNRIRAECDEDIIGMWDCDAIRRIFENLITNALKYGDPSAPVTVRVSDATETRIRISVHNTGNPIPPEEQKEIFKQFRRTRSAIEGSQRGWGIGLTLVKGLVEAHAGTVRLESGPARGTTFTVELPLDPRLNHPGISGNA